jgi:anti-sigma factor (TIGR02949 family)
MTDQIPPDCRAALRELEAFVDGELSPDLQTVIHDHLGGCTDCLETFDFHAELKAVIQRKCLNDELPPGLLAKIELCLQSDLDGDGEIG